jgi:endonuclease YncB( thermonuclease family)
MKRLLAFLFIVLLVTPAAAQDPLTGTVTYVRDGDTILVAGIPIRLNGIAAPEYYEPQGREARAFMQRLVTGKTLRCELNGERSYDRMIGICFLEGEDIGALIIGAGLARDCPRFSKGRYNTFNTAASKRLPLPDYCIRR